MPRRPLARQGPLLASLLLSLSALANEPPSLSGWPWDPDVTNVPAANRYPRPSRRVDNQRNVFALEHQGGWKTYLGDLHAHSRGHAEPGQATPNIQREEVALSAWYFGYDFIAITNHSTSWKLYDQLAPLSRPVSSAGSPEAPDLLALSGVESYAGPNDQTHFNAFNRLVILDTDSLTVWHSAITALYAEDPLRSTHVQLNHPNPDPWFRLPSPADPELRRIVRDAVELAEYNDRQIYFELLRRGFRVAPVSNTDTHASFQPWQLTPGPGSLASGVCLPEPGIPPEKCRGEQTGRRTGIVLPASESFSYESLLRALRERRAFHTTVASASGFFVVNQRPMGSEFTLAPGEQRLDFTVWGAIRQGRAGEGWKRLEVWSPYQPDQPLRVIELGDSAPMNLKQTLSLTPYEPIYVVRLERERPDAEVVLAPIWITNPIARPQLSLAPGLSAEEPPCLVIQGGGQALRLQRADFGEAAGTPEDWRTVAFLSPGGQCHPLDGESPSGPSRWRVVDAFQQEVVSNTLVLPERPAPRSKSDPHGFNP